MTFWRAELIVSGAWQVNLYSVAAQLSSVLVWGSRLVRLDQKYAISSNNQQRPVANPL